MKGCAALLLYWRPGQTAGAWYGSWRKGMEELLLKLVTVGLLAVIGWIDGLRVALPDMPLHNRILHSQVIFLPFLQQFPVSAVSQRQ